MAGCWSQGGTEQSWEPPPSGGVQSREAPSAWAPSLGLRRPRGSPSVLTALLGSARTPGG